MEKASKLQIEGKEGGNCDKRPSASGSSGDFMHMTPPPLELGLHPPPTDIRNFQTLSFSFNLAFLYFVVISGRHHSASPRTQRYF